MSKKSRFEVVILILMIGMSGIGVSTAYATEIGPAEDLATTVVWQVLQAPQTAFQSFWTGGGYWIVEQPANMTFAVGEINEDAIGSLTLGNMTVLTNDTMIARDLTLGVWGAVEFSPGLFIKTDTSAIEELNDTAFASAERIQGNYLNGTMHSYLDNYTFRDIEYESIFFEYQQDPTISGTPQHTQLVYSLSSGILLYANTSYYFGEPSEPYHLEIEFVTVDYQGTMPNLMIVYVIAFSIAVIIVGTIFLKHKK